MGVDAHTLIRLTDLTVDFESQEGIVHAVDKVSFSVAPRELVSLVGESGCGKSVTANAILGLTRVVSNATISGTIEFLGRDLAHLPPRLQLRAALLAGHRGVLAKGAGTLPHRPRPPFGVRRGAEPRRDAPLHRPRRTAADAVVGSDDRGGTVLLPLGAAPHHLSGPRHHDHGAGLQLVGDGLRDAFDPHQRRR